MRRKIRNLTRALLYSNNFLSEDESKLYKFEISGYNVVKSPESIKVSKGSFETNLRHESSDVSVFQQVYIEEEYKDTIGIINTNNIQINTIIDLGANIGLASLYFYEYFPDSIYICVEPDNNNFKLLEENTMVIPNKFLYKRAIWSSLKEVFLNKNFRDKKDWSISVSNSNYESFDKINTITLTQLMLENHIHEIDLLKIDIEGAESEIFNESNDLSFLSCTKVVAMEIHEEFNIRNTIIEILKKRKFALFQSNQTLIGVNSNFL